MHMKTPMEVVSIVEGTSTRIFQNIKLHVVPISSAYLGYGDFFISQENHLNLSKPLSQNSFLYLTVVNLIEKILKQQTKAREWQTNITKKIVINFPKRNLIFDKVEIKSYCRFI